MLNNKNLLNECVALAADQPARALVLLWLHLQDHGNLEQGLVRRQCEVDAERIQNALEAGTPWPVGHPVSILKALDAYLAAEGDYDPCALPLAVSVPSEEHDRTFHVIRRPRGWTSRMAENQAGELVYWLRHHQIVPAVHDGIEIGLTTPTAHLIGALAGPDIPAAAGGFPDGVRPDWNASSPSHCTQLLDPEPRWQSVEKLLGEATDFGARILVLPELTIDEDVRGRLCRWLRENARRHALELVVAGSFHEERPAGDGTLRRRNIAYVLDRWGEPLLCQTKLKPSRTVAIAGASDEAIEGASRAELLLSPIGLVGIGICIDFCSAGKVGLGTLWQTIGPGLMLVPSMSEETTDRAHLRRAGDLRREHGTAIVIATQRTDDSEAVGFLLRADGSQDRIDQPACFGYLRWPRSPA